MAEINKSKYENTILYLISHMSDHKIHGKKKLAKLLYYVDFDRFEYNESMESVTGDTYTHKRMGPYPDMMDTITSLMEQNGLLDKEERREFGGSYNPTVVYSSVHTPDLSVFDDDDKFILGRVAEQYGNANGTELQDQSHFEAPWLSVEDGETIPYEMAFYRGTFD